MAFAIRNFNVLAYIWHYNGGNDTLEAICKDGYFNDEDRTFEVGNMIVINAADGGCMVVVIEAGDIVRVAPLS